MLNKTIMCVMLLVLAVVMASCFGNTKEALNQDLLSEESRLNFTELAITHGAKTEEYDVVTEDGYVITLFHVLPMDVGGLGSNSLPVLLMHGVTDSADNFLLRGNTSLAITLSRRGYDVWAGNTRGVRYARRHLTLSDRDKKFWDYSMHENGFYDLATQIDFVLAKTGHKKLNAVAHSQGNTNFFILGSTRPEYNTKVNLVVALSPIAFLHDLGSIVKKLIDSTSLLNTLFLTLGMEELLSAPLADIYGLFCSQKRLAYNLCIKGVMFPLLGEDSEEFDENFYPLTIGHYPQPLSRKTALHFYQVASSRRFAQYDYGRQINLQKYNRTTPPDYDLSKVSMKVALFYGKNDGLSSVKNVARLRRLLPNVVDYWAVEWPKWNHVDWMWAKHLNQYLYPRLLRILEQYEGS